MKFTFRVTRFTGRLLVTMWTDGLVNGELTFTDAEWEAFKLTFLLSPVHSPTTKVEIIES